MFWKRTTLFCGTSICSFTAELSRCSTSKISLVDFFALFPIRLSRHQITSVQYEFRTKFSPQIFLAQISLCSVSRDARTLHGYWARVLILHSVQQTVSTCKHGNYAVHCLKIVWGSFQKWCRRQHVVKRLRVKRATRCGKKTSFDIWSCLPAADWSRMQTRRTSCRQTRLDASRSNHS